MAREPHIAGPVSQDNMGETHTSRKEQQFCVTSDIPASDRDMP